MTTEIRNVGDGEMLEVRVCEDGICRSGLVSSLHLVAPKENQLRDALERAARQAYGQG